MLKSKGWQWIAVLLVACDSESAEPRASEAPGAVDARDAEADGEPTDSSDTAEGVDADAVAPPSVDASVNAAPGSVDAGAAEADTGPAQVTDAGPRADATAPLPAPGCLAGIASFKEKGPFKFKAESVRDVVGPEQTEVRMQALVPELPAACKVPVVHFGRGTGASCSTYAPILEHLASHGFLVTCQEVGATGDGVRCLHALELAQHKYAALADDKIASMGDGEGGAGAYACLQRAEERWQGSKLYAALAMSPDSGLGGDSGWMERYGKIKSPVFQFHGTEAGIITESTVKRAYDALPDATEAYWYEAQGASEVKLAASWTQESSVAFFRWKLLGDADACRHFKQLPSGEAWDAHASQAAHECAGSAP